MGGEAIPSPYFEGVDRLRSTKKKWSVRSVRTVIEQNFTFSDLSPRFKNVDSSTGNIFCPFHENHSTPAAKMYWNDIKEIWVIYCFTEHKHFTAYDYVRLILCEQYQKYKSPLEFLLKNMSRDEAYIQLEAREKDREDQVEMETNAKAEYISMIASENEKTEDYIEALYLG